MPIYGPTGLNAGIILFNLTRLTNFPGGFYSSWMKMYERYKSKLQVGEQDIFNPLFNQVMTYDQFY